MVNKIIRLIFFGNYFIGVLAVALSLETVIQLRLPYNSFEYYVLLFCGTVMYYTYAYTGILHPYTTDNPRSLWYQEHKTLVKYSQFSLLLLCFVFATLLFLKTMANLPALPLVYWLVMVIIGLAVIFYYGLLPRSLIKLNLRNTGWLKAFVIGFVWAASVSLLPIVMLQLEHGSYYADPVIVIWLFIKNWMFCNVNAIMFDLKDYEDDTNHQLKTFVVRFGNRNTIFFVLTPLCLVGIFFTFIFAHYRHFTFLPVMFNVLPFLLLLMVTWAMLKQKNIFFYLIVIDGLVFIKALCGIAGMAFVPIKAQIMATNYDKIAWFYDFLSRIVFGKSIIKAHLVLLKYIPANSRILIVGGGTGWILEELAKQYNAGLTIDYVESSAKMIALSEKRSYGTNTVNFINLPIENFTAAYPYDVILTPFIFDNFKPDKTALVFNNLDAVLKSKGLWLYADFVYNEKEGALWQKLLLKVMYLFFHISANIETDEIENMEPFFDTRYQKIYEGWFYARFIVSSAWQKA